MARNVEAASHPTIAHRPDLVQLKCFYGWQPTVDAHTTRVLRGDTASANRVETKWAEHMGGSEEGGGVRRRRRRRGGEEGGVEEEWGRRRGGCVVS